LDEAKLELESAVKQVADAADLHELLTLGELEGKSKGSLGDGNHQSIFQGVDNNII